MISLYKDTDNFYEHSLFKNTIAKFLKLFFLSWLLEVRNFKWCICVILEIFLIDCSRTTDSNTYKKENRGIFRSRVKGNASIDLYVTILNNARLSFLFNMMQ